MTLEKEKLQKIVATVISALCVVVAYYYFVLDPIQLQHIGDLKKKIAGLQAKLEKAHANDKKYNLLMVASKQDEPFLAAQELKIVKGDHVAWLWREMGDFSDKERMPRVAVVPEGVGGMNGLPENDSYQAASASLNMYCGYHKVGEFVRDLENSFPTLQVQHLEILGGDSSGAESHTVRIQFQVMVLREEKQPSETPTAQATPAKE